MNRGKTIVIPCIVSLLAACAVGPDYRQPEVTAPDHFVMQDVFNKLADEQQKEQTKNKDSLPVNWWEGFSDPILTQLVEEALKNNYGISSAVARLTIAKERLNLVDSRDEIQANLGLDADMFYHDETRSDDDAAGGNIFSTFSFAWPLDVFGQNDKEIEAALAELEGANAELRGTILSVSANIASEYLRMRGNEQQLFLLEESVALQEKTLSIVQSRYDAGLAPELDLKRAEASVASLQADIPPLKESLINSRNNIAVLAGRFPGAYNDLLTQEESGIPTYQGRIPHLVPLEVLKLRPDVRQAEAELKRAVAEIGVAKAEFYPVFQLTKQISIGGSGISGEPTVGLFIDSIGILIQQFVLDGGARRARLNIAKAQAEEALADYRQTLLDAVEEVEKSLAALESSLDRQRSLAKAVEASERSFHQAEILYRQGLTSFLDVVDAQRVLASARQQLASAKTHFASQIANLFRVLGTEVRS